MISRLIAAFRLSDVDSIYFDRDDQMRRGLRAKALVLGIALYLPYCIFDVIAFPQYAASFLILRGGAALGMVMGCLWFIRAPTRTQRELAMLLYCAFATTGMYALSMITKDAAVYFHFGAAVSVLYGGVTFYIRPTLIILICIAIAPSFILTLSLSGLPIPIQIIDGMLMATAVATIAGSNIYRYKLERKQYEDEQILIQAKQAAEDALAQALEADKAKDNLLAGVSHELRTPMNAIIGFSDVMRTEIFGTIKPEAYREYVEHIHSSGLILRRNIDDLLDLSSSSMGKMGFQETRFRLAEAAANAVTLCTFRAEESQISLTFDGAENDVMIEADRQRLEQAIINLVTNAVKFSQPGQTVAVALDRTEDRGASISVSDRGCGIARDALDSITDPFVQQQSDTQKSGYGGLGIGLTIVSNIMEAIGGSLTIESTPGSGTIATLNFSKESIVSQLNQRRPRKETLSAASERKKTG